MTLPNTRPNDVRGFVHRKIGGAIKGAVTGFITGGPLGAIGGAAGGFASGGSGGAVAGPRIISTRPQPINIQRAGPCATGFFRNPGTGQCSPLGPATQVPGLKGTIQRVLPGGASGFVDFGTAVMGRYGAALEPGIADIAKRVCPRGTVLGNDGLCYNRRDLRNSERAWPRGRRPLLTGGEMRAITIAASAARKMAAKQKQLQALGLLKKPMARRQKAVTPVVHTYEHKD